MVTIGDSRVFVTHWDRKTAGHLWRRSCVNARDQNWYNGWGWEVTVLEDRPNLQTMPEEPGQVM